SGAAYARLVEPGWLELTERACHFPNLARPVALLHLSDFHASKDVPRSLIERAIQMAIDARPDVICITGDFVSDRSGFDPDWYTAVLRRLSTKAPTFAVLGNHDGGGWSASEGGFRGTTEVGRIVEDAGVHLLANRSSRIVLNGAALQIVGVGDLWAGELDADRAFREADGRLPTVLLSHNPDSKALVGNHGWRLMLSGHTHGGQVVMPVLGLNPAPVKDRGYIAGMKPWQDRWIHVSRGVGNISGVRFNCRPEVTKIHLLPA
ncbi:MAG: metallophosphoesterase, partial [Bryobacterales bacterium]|nr:metallophosphoesterase [Bryobacterales bacterium]